MKLETCIHSLKCTKQNCQLVLPTAHSRPIHIYRSHRNCYTSHKRLRASPITSEASSPAETATTQFTPLEGKYSYKQLRLLPTKQIKYELELRHLPCLGFKSSMAARLYQAFAEEGRALNSAESALVDAELPDSMSDYDSTDDQSDNAKGAKGRLYNLQQTVTGVTLEQDEERLMSNKSRLQATFLTQIETPNGIKVAPSLAVRTLQSVWLFDCGEDTQRALIGHPLLDWKRIERIFLGSVSTDSILGLPGMLCTLSGSRERGHENADFPIHVYGPPGTVQFVSSMLSISRTYLEMPVIIHELVTTPVPPERLNRPVEVLKRSRLYAVQLPPDQLNPDGYYDGTLEVMLTRHTRKRSTMREDLRSTVLPLDFPPPGDPSLQGLSVSQMTWTFSTGPEFKVTAYPLKSKRPSFGFKIAEGARAGKLYPDVAVALGVTEQSDFAALKYGTDVTTEDGRVVRPSQCVGPPKPGRSMAIVTQCADSSLFGEKAGACDVLIHGMLPPKVAGSCAAKVDARELILWQQNPSFVDCQEAFDEDFPVKVMEEARGAFGKDVVSFGGSYPIYQWEMEEGNILPPEVPPELEHLVLNKQ